MLDTVGDGVKLKSACPHLAWGQALFNFTPSPIGILQSMDSALYFFCPFLEIIGISAEKL